MVKNNTKLMGAAFDDLQSLDWNLKNVNTSKYSATIHPYHARFIPQIPERIIEAYTEKGDVVLDPFNGSGTTTMVSGAMQRSGIGVDLNPLACLIARVKCRNYDIAHLKSHINNFLEKVHQNVRTVDSQQRINDFINSHHEDPQIKIPDFPDQDRWYVDNVLQQMGALYYLIENIESERIREFYKVCFSGITKTICRSSEDWTYIGDNMLPDKKTNRLIPDNKEYDVYQIFESQVNKVLRGVKQFSETDPIEGDIHQTDSRNLDFIESSSVNFAITSPPYANAVDYARYHRLSFYWFGWEIDRTKEQEIGARAKRGRKDAVEDYFYESQEVYEEVFRVLKPESHFCIVVGDTQHRNERVEAVDQISEMCKKIGYKEEGEIIREVSSQSMSQKNITEESLLFFSKP